MPGIRQGTHKIQLLPLLRHHHDNGYVPLLLSVFYLQRRFRGAFELKCEGVHQWGAKAL